MIQKVLIGIFSILFLSVVYIILSTEKGVKIPALSDNSNLPNFEQITKEAASDLQEYIRIKSVQNEEEAANFLKNKLEKEGIEVRLFPHPKDPTRVNLVAEIKGKEQNGGVILSNHIDVVDVDENEWDHPPFSGKKINGKIFGRGAVDMKGLGIMQLHAFILVSKLKIPLKYNLMFLALADEETRSRYGAQYILKEYPDLFQGYEYMHNEGGTGTQDVVVKGSKIFNLQYAEKGIVWMSVESKGESGHGSTPPNQYATKNLIDFINALHSIEPDFTISDVTASFFYQMGEISPFPNSFVLKRNRNPILKKILDGVIRSNKHLRAMTSNTVSITGLESEYKGINVIHNSAKAYLDFRILPGVVPEEFIEKIKQLASNYNTTVKVIHSEPATVSPLDSKFFQVFAGTAQKVIPGSIIAPFLSPGTTDSSYFRTIGIKCYGLIPALLTNEEIDGIHGKNESLTISHLQTGIQIIYETILNYNKE